MQGSKRVARGPRYARQLAAAERAARHFTLRPRAVDHDVDHVFRSGSLESVSGFELLLGCQAFGGVEGREALTIDLHTVGARGEVFEGKTAICAGRALGERAPFRGEPYARGGHGLTRVVEHAAVDPRWRRRRLGRGLRFETERVAVEDARLDRVAVATRRFEL